MLIAFDLDGTLFDTWPCYQRATEIYCERHKLNMPDLALLKRGLGHPERFDYGWGGTTDEQNVRRFEIYDLVFELDSDPVTRIPLFPGMHDLLHKLHDTYHELAIVTSRPDAPTHAALRHAGVDHIFDYVLGEETRRTLGLRGKPNPDMLRHVIEKLAHKPESTVMVGDSEMDMQMGRASGSTTLGVAWGIHEPAFLTAAGAHFLIEDIAALEKHLFSLAK